MNIFFDTEFTQFREGQLLSVGLVSEADDELVVEIHDSLRHALASKFCQDVVIPQFGAVSASRVGTDLELGRVVAAWLGKFELPLTLYYDYKLDRHFLREALSGAEDWRILEPQVSWVNVADEARCTECRIAQERYFREQVFPARHHPLIDAKAMRERWRVHADRAARGVARSKDEPWYVEAQWENNWFTLFENADRTWRSFATREEAVREIIGDAGGVEIWVTSPDGASGYWRTFAPGEESELAALEHDGDLRLTSGEVVRIV
jgi:hypothetical protein